MRVIEPVPDDEQRRQAWRAAALAYRKVRGTGALDHPARLAAVDAVIKVWPACADPMAEATAAIAYAASQHTKWFWRPLVAHLEDKRSGSAG